MIAVYILAGIGAWFLTSMGLLLIWIAANERAGRRASRRPVRGWDGSDAPIVGRGGWR